ncbi:hypothetical protein PUR49_11060 [Streptomyces sp. BE147]|uniref:hypothetical protein n=1 Tax=Streptomyces sp. BE147 TaxID=3002524 RepID=UPI002E7A7B70|nr:hypothetical protein [Streptomyces sp. BE147]MEE1737035.1 hypothetical protein [Streptomyces sp. BE147]
MSLTMLHLDNSPAPEDWVELSSYNPAAGGFQWRDLLSGQDIDASYHYNDDVRRMLHTAPGTAAHLQELGELLLINTVREAMRLAVCVLRPEGNSELRRADDSSAFTTTQM